MAFQMNSGLQQFMDQMMGVKRPKGYYASKAGSGTAAPAAPAAPMLGSLASSYFGKKPMAGLTPGPQAGLAPPVASPQAGLGGNMAAAEAWKSRYGSNPSWFKG